MIFMEDARDRCDAGFRDAEIFAEAFYKRMAKPIADAVPKCVTKQIADHEGNVNWRKRHKPELIQNATQHRQNRPFCKGNDGHNAVHGIIVDMNHLYKPLLHKHHSTIKLSEKLGIALDYMVKGKREQTRQNRPIEADFVCSLKNKKSE